MLYMCYVTVLQYLIVAEGLVFTLQVRQRHPQGLQLGATSQQLSLQLVPEALHALRLRLQTGQLHCAHKSSVLQGDSHFLSVVLTKRLNVY